jgi:hypothetical protein
VLWLYLAAVAGTLARYRILLARTEGSGAASPLPWLRGSRPSIQLRRSRRVLRTAGMGHEERFPPTRLIFSMALMIGREANSAHAAAKAARASSIEHRPPWCTSASTNRWSRRSCAASSSTSVQPRSKNSQRTSCMDGLIYQTSLAGAYFGLPPSHRGPRSPAMLPRGIYYM